MTEIDAGVLHAEPQLIDVSTELNHEVAIPFRIFVGASEVDDATFAMSGPAVGMLRGDDFVVTGLAAGQSTLAVTHAGHTIQVPIRARVHSMRIVDATPASAVTALDAATPAPFDADLTPADGAQIPPNLGTLEVDFAGQAGDDVFEVRASTEDLDLRVIGPAAHVALSPLEWRVIAASAPDGRDVALTSRSLASTTPTLARTQTTRVRIGKQPMAQTMLFGGVTTGAPALYRYDARNGGSTAWMSPSLAPDLDDPRVYGVGAHTSISSDGARIAAIEATTGGHASIIDVVTRSFLTLDSPNVTWTSSTYDPSGLLITAQAGVLTLRDGDTATPLQTLVTDGPAASPAVSPDGSTLLYGVLGAGSITTELRAHAWDATTATLGPARVLAPADGSGIEDPSFSSNGAWVVYGRAAGGLRLVRADGAGAPVDLSTDPGDSVAAWASDAGVDGAWVVIRSKRTVGGSERPPQLWLAAFDAATGTLSTPFHLPGQPADLTANHAPRRMPF